MKKIMNTIITGSTITALVFLLAACGGLGKKPVEKETTTEATARETIVQAQTTVPETTVQAQTTVPETTVQTQAAVPETTAEPTWEISDDCTTLTIKGNGAWTTSYEDAQTITNFGQTITTLIVEEGITSISYNPTNIFAVTNEGGLYKLTDVSLPSTLKEINGMFNGAVSLKEIEIPEGVTTIGSHAFGLCGFTEITIPESVTFIGERAFWQCDDLETVNILGTVDLAEEAFCSCDNLSNFNANVIRSIESGALDGCPIETLVLNEGLEKVDESAFMYTNLKSITFPSSLKEMSKYWNYWCYTLEEVKYDGTMKDWILMGLDTEFKTGLLNDRTVVVEFLR